MVRRVALSELAAVGYGAFTIEAVARRSGVAKSTIYRHWPGKLALIADALDTLNVQTPAGALAAEAPPRERVEQLLQHLADAFRDPVITGCTPALIEASEHDAEVRAFHHAYATARRQALVDAIADGVSDGSFPAGVDPDIAATAMAGAIVYRRVMTDTPFRTRRRAGPDRGPARRPDRRRLLCLVPRGGLRRPRASRRGWRLCRSTRPPR